MIDHIQGHLEIHTQPLQPCKTYQLSPIEHIQQQHFKINFINAKYVNGCVLVDIQTAQAFRRRYPDFIIGTSAVVVGFPSLFIRKLITQH
jgi:hypothetical protein